MIRTEGLRDERAASPLARLERPLVIPTVASLRT
jgi:hypothetical protein